MPLFLSCKQFTGSPKAIDYPFVGEGNFETGGYLYSIAACAKCHTRNNSQEFIDNRKNFPPAFLEKFNNNPRYFVKFIKGSSAPPEHKGYEWMSDSDIYSIYLLISSSKGFNIKEEKGQPLLNLSLGILGNKDIRGFTPDSKDRGSYLFNTINRCSYCHNSETSKFLNIIKSKSLLNQYFLKNNNLNCPTQYFNKMNDGDKIKLSEFINSKF